ncbi:MAG: transaldolase family protein [candidate division Zixibacteria bacterium]|nr:transaldolase family protein [candidate division Zixibacteria bacterium]
MELYIDTANIQEIKEALSWGCITGATTNPKIMSNEKGGYSFKDKILEIVELVKEPVSVEVTEEDFQGMVDEAKIYASWHENIVIKIPMGIEGLKAVARLEKYENVKTNVTAIMATNQAILAALSGASYASIFYGRISDMGYDPVGVIKETSALYKELNIRTKLIVGSIRTILDVNKAFLAGADIVTVPFPILKKMTQNPKTEETIKEFNSIWKEMKEKGLIRLDQETPARKLTFALANEV